MRHGVVIARYYFFHYLAAKLLPMIWVSFSSQSLKPLYASAATSLKSSVPEAVIAKVFSDGSHVYYVIGCRAVILPLLAIAR